MQAQKEKTTNNRKRRMNTYKSKSNLHYTRGITPQHVTSGLAPEQHSSEETLQRWRHDLTGLGIETQTSCVITDAFTH